MPTAARHKLLPAERGSLFGFLILTLFYLTQNVSSVFFQARGIPQADSQAAVPAFMGGVILGALLLTWLEHKPAWRKEGSAGAALRVAHTAVLSLAPLLCLGVFQLTGFSGNRLLNVLLPLLWGLPLSTVFRLFFRFCPPDTRAFIFGLGIGIGHLCWAFLIPLIHPGSETTLGGLSFGLENRYLPFLNLTRCLSGLALALLCCWMLGPGSAGSRAGNGSEDSRSGSAAAFPARAFAALLLPFVACLLLNGYMGYLFFTRLLGRGLYPEYMHLALALFFPLLGYWLSRRQETGLFPLLAWALCLFSLLSLLFFLPVPLGLKQAAYLICSCAHQLLLYAGTLACAAFAPLSRYPALVISGLWLSLPAATFGRLLASNLPEQPPVLAGLGGFLLVPLCIFLALRVLRRAFPLPGPGKSAIREAAGEAPGEASGEAPETGQSDKPVEDGRKRLDFAASFKLTAREEEVLQGLLAGSKYKEIGERLGISERTVKFHVCGLLQKSGSKNRLQFQRFYANWQNRP